MYTERAETAAVSRGTSQVITKLGSPTPRLSEESEERRDEASQLWRNCTRDNVEAGESYFALNLAADW